MMIIGPGYSGDTMLHYLALLPLANAVSRSDFYRSIQAHCTNFLWAITVRMCSWYHFCMEPPCLKLLALAQVHAPRLWLELPFPLPIYLALALQSNSSHLRVV